jgi:hypothetical protein
MNHELYFVGIEGLYVHAFLLFTSFCIHHVHYYIIANFAVEISIYMNVKLIRYQLWYTRCAFRLLKSHSDAQVEKVGNPKKKCKNWKSRRIKTKQSAMKLNQIRRRIELCLREIILRFEMNLQNLLFSWPLKYNKTYRFDMSSNIYSVPDYYALMIE